MWMHQSCTGVGRTPKEKIKNMKTLSGKFIDVIRNTQTYVIEK